MFWIYLLLLFIGLTLIVTGGFTMAFSDSVDGMRDISSRHTANPTNVYQPRKTASTAAKLLLVGLAMSGISFLLMVYGGA